MTLSELCIRRPVMTTLITASIIAFGVFGFRLLPVSALPKVDFPTIAVTATLPGASADTMAASVAGADRAPALDHRRHLVDVVDLLAGHQPRSPFSSISTATSTPPRSTCRPR